MSDDLLQTIQELQYTDRSAAEALLMPFIGGQFDLDVVDVELRPSAISLNSFNGFVTLRDGRRYFFKTHTESDTVIGEYYRGALLREAGYPVIQPIFHSTETGKQLLIYDVIESPSVFDVAWSIENGDTSSLKSLTVAQSKADDDLFGLYESSLHQQSAADAADAPVHQLFHHRLQYGRFERFYGALDLDSTDSTPSVNLPNFRTDAAFVRRASWEINGQRYQETLDQLVNRALQRLHPAHEGPAIIGHGDAHNGNVFLRDEDREANLLYFDPAFAGEHHPLLDLTKPLFHNVFAMWMYFPQQMLSRLNVQMHVDQDHIRMTYNRELPAVRKMFLENKVRRVLIPTLRLLRERNQLHEDWRQYLKLALMCCPLLTLNLADETRFPPAITLLGFAMTVEMGAESLGSRSLIDLTLDEVEASI